MLERKALIDTNAHLTRPWLTDLDRCPVQNLGTASLPNLNRMRHQGFHRSINFLRFLTENRQFHKFIIIKIMLPSTHDSAVPRSYRKLPYLP
jgi:hypothetical protein